MVCPACSEEPIAFGRYMRKSQVLTLTCQRCGANLRLDRWSIIRFSALALGAGCILGFLGIKAYFDSNTTLPNYIAIPGALLCLAALILAIKAWTWKIYRYKVKSSVTAAQ